MRKEKLTFDEFYRTQYKERWDGLRDALLSEEEDKFSPEGLVSEYFMDRTSAETAALLPVHPGDSVLDMCAAPGGKSLIIAKKLGGSGCLIANDRSADRRERMRKVFLSSLSENERSIIKITGHDASRWGLFEKEIYDAVLLDAPCSSERHVIRSEKHLSAWSASRPKHLEAQQYTMLSSALIAARHGGYILYSTCSLSSGENEEIIARLMRKKPGLCEEIPIDLEYGERREYGMIVLPDRSGGRGPMYAALLRKIQ